MVQRGGVGNLVIPIIALHSLSFPKVRQGSLVPSPLEPPALNYPIVRVLSLGTWGFGSSVPGLGFRVSGLKDYS